MKPLTLPIARWMVGSGTRFCNTISEAKLLEQKVLETRALVGMNAAWYSKLIKPLKNQHSDYRRGPLVPDWDSDCEFAENVS